MGHSGRGRPGSRRRGAFTLVEVVVVIGIILLLAALTLSVSVAVVGNSEVRQTEVVLRQLESAVQEWQTISDRRISWGSGVGYDMQDGTPHVFLVSELLNTVARSSAIKSMLAQIDPDFVHVYDSSQSPPGWLQAVNPYDPDPNSASALGEFTAGDWNDSLAILDAWGLPFRIVHPGCVDGSAGCTSTTTVDADGTVRTAIEDIYGISKNRQILFVSAGPDGEFGDLHLDTAFNSLNADAKQDVLRASDNSYSYPPSLQRPQP